MSLDEIALRLLQHKEVYPGTHLWNAAAQWLMNSFGYTKEVASQINVNLDLDGQRIASLVPTQLVDGT